MSGKNQDQDGLTRAGETVRDAKRRGGKTQPSRGKSRQSYGAATTASGTSWLQVRSDWESGAFTERGLADAHGVHIATLRSRMRRKGDEWGPRPLQGMVSRALPGLVDALPSGRDASSETIEAIIAQAEGRPVDAAALSAERVNASVQRKAVTLRSHREMADSYARLAQTTLKLLTDYAAGNLPCAYVRSKDHEGKDIIIPFHLLSKQHGLMDGVDKVGSILGRAFALQRSAHGLEDVDGDGNPKKPNGAGVANPYSRLTDEELVAKLGALSTALASPSRLTPVPPVLAAMNA